jgi:HEAT repeat protein
LNYRHSRVSGQVRVTGKHWLKAMALSAAVAAALPALRADAQPAGGAPGLSPADEIEQLQRNLFETGTRSREDAAKRDEAAKRLLQRGAYEVLLQGLRSGRGNVQVSVARALAEQENPPAVFLDDLMRCLDASVSAELAEAASQAVANYRDNPAARKTLRDLILTANASEGVRLPAIKALGTLNDKETARFLVETVLRGDDGQRTTARLSDAAADALGEMTGKTEFGRDLGQWNAWWQGERDKTDAQFLNDRRIERERRFGQANQGLKSLASNLDKLMFDMHRLAKDDAEREALVLRLLNDTSPEIRAAGARLVEQERAEGVTVRPTVVGRLRELIGDSSPDVRQRVATAIRSINDPASSKALLAQLRIESRPDVKAALMFALGPTKDVSAVPELIALLKDSRFQVSEAAAKALADLGPEIVKSPDLTHRVSGALAETIERTNTERGATRLREIVVQAMVPLKDPALVRTLFTLLEDRGGSNPNIRRSAIRALSPMGATPLRNEIAQRIADVLAGERDRGVRLEAAAALGIVGSVAQADALYARMDVNREKDPDVRNEAWNSLSSLLGDFTVQDLVNWADIRFKGMPEQQMAAYLVLNEKLIRAGASSELAVVREKLGRLCLEGGKPESAISYLRGALDYWDAKPDSTVETIQQNLMKAYLQSKRYKDAVQFAGERIARIKVAENPNKAVMAREILYEVDRLEKANQLDAALDLLKEAKSLDVGTLYTQRLEERDRDIRSKIPALRELYIRPWSEVVA